MAQNSACITRTGQKLKEIWCYSCWNDIISSKKSRELAPLKRPNGSDGGSLISESVCAPTFMTSLRFHFCVNSSVIVRAGYPVRKIPEQEISYLRLINSWYFAIHDMLCLSDFCFTIFTMYEVIGNLKKKSLLLQSHQNSFLKTTTKRWNQKVKQISAKTKVIPTFVSIFVSAKITSF